jgi:hypothetical protein
VGLGTLIFERNIMKKVVVNNSELGPFVGSRVGCFGQC